MKEPKCLTRMKLSECWGDNLNVEELKEVNAYIEQLESNWNELKKWLEEEINIDIDNIGAYESTLQEVLNKMQELESKDD